MLRSAEMEEQCASPGTCDQGQMLPTYPHISDTGPSTGEFYGRSAAAGHAPRSQTLSLEHSGWSHGTTLHRPSSFSSEAADSRRHAVTTARREDAPPWQKLVPPSMPMYRRPVTRANFRGQWWTVLKTFSGEMLVASDKMTNLRKGPNGSSQPQGPNSDAWALATSTEATQGTGPYDDDKATCTYVPWSRDSCRSLSLGSTTTSHSTQVLREGTGNAQNRAFALRCFTTSASDISVLTHGPLTVDILRPAGRPNEGIQGTPRSKQNNRFPEQLYRLGVATATTTMSGATTGGSLDAASATSHGTEEEGASEHKPTQTEGFPAAALLPGSLRMGTAGAHVPFVDRPLEARPGLPLPPPHNPAAATAAMANSRRRQLAPRPHSTTLPEDPAPLLDRCRQLAAASAAAPSRADGDAGRASGTYKIGSLEQTILWAPDAAYSNRSALAPRSAARGGTDVAAAAVDDVAFGWTYRRDYVSPAAARGRCDHTYFGAAHAGGAMDLDGARRTAGREPHSTVARLFKAPLPAAQTKAL